MRKLQAVLEKWSDTLDKNWRVLELQKQQRYTLYFFIGYLLLTAAVLYDAFLDRAASDSQMEISHIENPALKKKYSSEETKEKLKNNPKNK